MKTIKTISIILILIILGLSSCTTNEEKENNPEENTIINIPTATEAIQIPCEDKNGECIDWPILVEKIYQEEDFLKDKTISIYKCEGLGRCIVPSTLPFDAKEAYELLFTAQYLGMLSDEESPVAYEYEGNDIHIIKQNGDRYVVNKDTGILYCIINNQGTFCNQMLFAVVNGQIIIDNEGEIGCEPIAGDCKQENIEEYKRRKSRLPNQ